jgi:hypothetical protein
MFLAFAAALALSLARGRTLPCFCFGSPHELISLRSLSRILLMAGIELTLCLEVWINGLPKRRTPVASPHDVLVWLPPTACALLTAMWILSLQKILKTFHWGKKTIPNRPMVEME